MNNIPYAYETFAKLNIMSPMASAYSASQPQLMFSLVNNNANKAWKGQRVAFNYTNGGLNAAPLFRIHEKSRTEGSNLNFDLLGNNNIYQGIKGAYSDSFIYSQDNEITQHVRDCSFINSDWNYVDRYGRKIEFWNSNYNTVHCGQVDGSKTTEAHDIQFYGTDNSYIFPFYEKYPIYGAIKGQKGTKGNKSKWTASLAQKAQKGTVSLSGVIGTRYVGGTLNNLFLMNSDESFFNGFTDASFQGTYLSSPRSKHELTHDATYEVNIGNDLGWSRYNAGGLIAIGRGLTYIKGQGDKIILGNFNENDTDENNVLIVGDGWIDDDYLTSIEPQLKTASGDVRFWNKFSGRGDKVNYYRHNLMKVNRKGWVGIYDYGDPDNHFAMYGVKGITAHFDNNIYRIPFDKLYAKLNVYDTISEYQDTIDRYTDEVNTFIRSVPQNKTLLISGDVNNLSAAAAASFNVSKLEGGSIINVTLQNSTMAANAEVSVSSNIQWGRSGNVQTRYDVAKLHPYNSVQYLFIRDTENHVTGFSRINN